MIVGLEEENLEDKPCSVCLDENTYEDNEIIFCEKCNVAVHQFCYDVYTIPDGPWYCDVCRAGEDPTTAVCRLCNFTGGAYKRTDVPNTWAHSLCMSWIPDSFVETNNKKEYIINCSSVDKSRYRLKCIVCNKSGGACIQCSYRRCCIAAHPFCALNKGRFTHRIVKSEDVQGAYDWEMFCPNHADAVRDPVKPKLKSKKQSESAAKDTVSENGSENGPVTKNRKGRQSKASQSDRRSSGAASGRSGGVKPDYAALNGDAMTSDDDYSVMDSCGRTKKQGARPSRSKQADSNPPPPRHAAATVSADPDSLAILNLTDWPGQAEGEPLDLQHFWNVVSMMYPEDRSVETTWTMMQPLLDLDNEVPYESFPPAVGDISNTLKRLAEGDEELLSGALGTDKERLNCSDEWKMSQLLEAIASAVASLQGLGGSDRQSGYADEDEEEGTAPAVARRGDNETTTAYDLTPMEYFVVGDAEASGGQKTGSNFFRQLVADMPPPCCVEEKRLCVVYDSVSPQHRRAACFYGVCSAGCPLQQNHCSNFVNLSNVALDGLDCLHIRPSTAWDDEKACLMSEYPTSGGSYTPDAARVRLLVKSDVPDDAALPLHSTTVIPKQDEDEICTYMRRDMKAYRTLLKAIAAKARSVVESEEIRACEGVQLKNATDMQRVESKYLNQRIWKRVASSMAKGVRDQRPDFNRTVMDEVPASWTIKVGDRAGIIAAAEKAPSEDGAEPHEDSVCMVCFDGTSAEGNSIIFCDGCNSPAHQNCYGIVDIPEGDFFCDRCRAVQVLAEEYDDLGDVCVIKDLYKCCLCPLYHGGMKPTTDGRWVHLCCAVWCGSDVTISNLEEMSSIDITGVSIVRPADKGSMSVAASTSSSKQDRELDASATAVESAVALTADAPDGVPVVEAPVQATLVVTEISDVVVREQTENTLELSLMSVSREVGNVEEPQCDRCMVCNLSMGHLVQCSHDGSSCCKLVHPLCAWFAGCFVKCEVTDPSFLAADRADSNYPAGISLTLHCPDHSHVVGEEAVSWRQDQVKLRQQYRIVEADLDYIPGTKRRKASSKKKKKIGAESSGPSRVAAGNINKDLPDDLYDSSMCALCLQPTSRLLDIGTDAPVTDTISCSGCGIVVHTKCARNTLTVVGGMFPPLDSIEVAGTIQRLQHSMTTKPNLKELVKNEGVVEEIVGHAPADLSASVTGGHVAHAEPVADGIAATTVPSAVVEEVPLPDTLLTAVAPNHLVVASGDSVVKAECEDTFTQVATDSMVATTGTMSNVTTANVTKSTSPSGSNSNLCYLTTLGQTSSGSASAGGGASCTPQASDLQHIPWTCDSCVSRHAGDLGESEETRCQLCPRRGGALVKTQYGRWLHGYCADHLCAIVKDSTPRLHSPNLITVKNVPGTKKQNCSVCNRKTGVCVKCSHPECSVLFHPICAQRAGTHFIHISNGVKTHFCPSHIPPQVYRLSPPQAPGSVYWVNAQQVKQMRVSMDKARVILDLVVRRERTRRALVRAEGEMFEKKFKTMCRRLLSKYRLALNGPQDQDSAAENKQIGEGGDDAQGDVGAVADSTTQAVCTDPPGNVIDSTTQGAPAEPASKVETAPLTPALVPELTEAMRELFGPVMSGKDVLALGGEDDDVTFDLDNDDFDAYNENVMLSPGLMKLKKSNLLGGSAPASSKRVRKRNPLDAVLGPVSVEDDVAQPVDGGSASADSKRRRKSTSKYDHLPVVHEAPVIVEEPPVSSKKSIDRRRQTDPKREKPKVLAEVKQFDITTNDSAPTPVDISSSWLTRASRRLSEDEVLYFSSSDPKYMLNMPLLQSVVAEVSGQKYDGTEIGDDADEYSERVRSDIEQALSITRSTTGIFVDQDAANEFDAELGEYLDYCENMSVKALERELHRSGVVKYKKKPLPTALPPPKATPVSHADEIVVKNKVAVVTEERRPKPAVARHTKQLTLNFGAKDVPVSPSKIKSSSGSTKRKADTEAAAMVASPQPSKKTKESEKFLLVSPSSSRPAPVHSEEAESLANSMKTLFPAGRPGAFPAGFSAVIDDVFAENARLVTAMKNSDVVALRQMFNDVSCILSAEDLLSLERKCSYILQRIEDFKVPEGAEIEVKWAEVETFLNDVTGSIGGSHSGGRKPSRSTAVKQTAKSARPVSSVVATREISEMYREFLYEDTPELRAELSIQCPPLSLALMRNRLQTHSYPSMWGFASDFFCMLNIYRRIPPPQSSVSWDTALLAALFERSLAECSVPRNAESKLARTITDMTPDTSPDTDMAPLGVCRLQCRLCHKKFRSRSWPADSLTPDCSSFTDSCNTTGASSSSRRRSKGGSPSVQPWCWQCPDCLHEHGGGLVGCPIRVWWPGDAVYYDGTVDAFDTFSLLHRVNYDDGEWEFVDLSAEPYVVAIPEEKCPGKASQRARPSARKR